MSETTREAAERIVRETILVVPGKIADKYIAAIEAALDAERERAAKIAETEAGTRCMRHQKTGKGVCGYEIANLIRGKQ